MFHKQKNEFGCGPVSILNAVVWATGKRFAYSNYKEIAKLCKTDRIGTYDSDMERVLKKYGKKYGFKVTKKEDVKPYEVSAELNSLYGKAVIVAHPDYIDPEDWHWSFAYNSSNIHVGAVNLYAKKTIEVDIKMYWFDFRNFLNLCLVKRKEPECLTMFILERY